MSAHGADDHGKGHGHAPAPQPQICRCGLTPWPMVMTCACMAPPAPAHDDHHEEPKPKPPTFGDDVPEAVQIGLREAWLGLEAGRPPIGIIADCERVVTLMLNELDGNGRLVRPVPERKGWFGTKPKPEPQPEIKVRIEALIKAGKLLRSLDDLIKQVDLPTAMAMNAGAPLGNKPQATAFVHLALMIAEQGFAHPQWARTRQRPPQWP